MDHDVDLPNVFTPLRGQVRFVRRHSATEYSSTCPKCKDIGHSGSEVPDRFRLFVDEHPLGWCRKCGYIWFPDSGDPSKPQPSLAQIEAWRKEQVEREEARKRSAEHALELLRESAFWERLHNQMGEVGSAYWRKCGISDGWQNFWMLGWIRGRAFGGITCDAASIPIFGAGWQIKQIKYRLMDEGKGRYRYEPSGVEAMPFLCDPDADYSGHVMACEGEKKAAVVFSALGDGKAATIGMPGTNPGQPTLDLLKNAYRVTLIMDPDAREAAWNICKQIGTKKCNVFIPTERMGKIDDFVNREHPSAHELYWLIRQGAMPAWR